jgi:hypothetical protein
MDPHLREIDLMRKRKPRTQVQDLEKRLEARGRKTTLILHDYEPTVCRATALPNR